MVWTEPGRAWAGGRWAIDVRGDELADIAVDGVVALRSVRLVLRDSDWGTIDLDLEGCETTPAGATLHVRGGGITGTVAVHVGDDRLEVVADVTTERDVDTNRLGLVVLHPLTVAGTDLAVTHTGGGVERTRFPLAISPHQPARDVAGLAWRHGGLALTATFEGDVFEMEDQRNWSDASFKTYNRPLDLPFPYRLAAGSRVRQTVTVHAAGARDTADIGADEMILRPAGTVPAIGVGASTAPDPAPRPAPVGAFLRVELDLASPAWPAALARAAASGLPLDVRLVRASPARLAVAAAALPGLDVRTVGAYADDGPEKHLSDAATVAALRQALRAEGLDLPVVGGVRTHFTELNRGHALLPDDLDGVTFALTPLFHSRATAQLVESLSVLPLIARQAVEIAGDASVHVGPVTLRPHVEAVALTPEPVPGTPDLRDGYGPALLDAVDARQSAPELGAWTVASVAALTMPGIASVAFFEEWGPRGIRSTDGEPLPVAEALTALSSLAGDPVDVGRSTDGRVWVLRARTPGGPVVMAANLDVVERAISTGEQTTTIPPGRWVHTGSTTPPPATTRS